jgi:dipeptidyl aminopeptidase/acylaminoacyl peptidase
MEIGCVLLWREDLDMDIRFGIDRFLNIRTAVDPSFSPDGRFLAFLSNITGVSQVWQVPIEGGWPVQLTFSSEPVHAVYYHPLRHELIYSMDTGGNERNQLHWLRSIGQADHGLGEGWLSTDLSKAPKAIHSFGGWSPDGDRFAFSSNREDPGRFDLYVQKLDGTAARLVARGPGGYYRAAAWSPDGKSVLVHRLESSANHDYYVVDVTTGQARHLTPHQGSAQYEEAKWSADGKSIWCVSNAGGRDRQGLARIDLDSLKVQFEPEPDEHEIEDLEVSPRGRWLAWLTNVDGKSVLKLRDLKGTQTHTASLPLGVISGLAFAPDESRLALVLSGPRHNADVWVWELPAGPGKNEGKPRQLTSSSRAGLPFSQFVQPELIRYKTFDGRMVPAWFYPPATPQSGRLPPFIVYPHGGPESQTRPAFNPLFQYFCQAGYGILAPNVRGSTGYGTAYMNLDNTVKRMDSVADLAHAAYWLRDQKKADPKRLAVYGGSYGGFMVLAQVTHYPDLWAAGIDVVGICNFLTFLEKTGAYRRAHREAEYGNLREHREFLEKISPINHVEKVRCPMLVIHGANDPRVPIEEAEQIVAGLKKRNIPVDYLRYEDEGHGLAKLKNRLDAYPKMVAFLDRYLK